MDKKLKQSLLVAAKRNELIVVWLKNGEQVKGYAETANYDGRIKINTENSSVWIPMSDVESISRVIRLRVEGNK